MRSKMRFDGVKFFITTGVVLAVSWAIWAPAIKTEKVEIGAGDQYDGAVYIERNELGLLVFRDVQSGGEVPLSALIGGGWTGDHGGMLGLQDDDHLQYLTAARHADEHTAAFNAALPIPPDIDGNATLGDHLNDAFIHGARGPIVFDWLSSDSDRGTAAVIHYQVQVAVSPEAFNEEDFIVDADTRVDATNFYVGDGRWIDPYPASGLTSIDAGKRIFYRLPAALSGSPFYCIRVTAWDGAARSASETMIRQ